MKDEYVEPEVQPFEPRPYLKSWLMDPNARDQFALQRGEEFTIYWNNKSEKPQLETSRLNWSDTFVMWSPLGSYMATFHKQGIALWGGATFDKIVRFSHPGARLIDFSPNEKYITTWSPERINIDGESHVS